MANTYDNTYDQRVQNVVNSVNNLFSSHMTEDERNAKLTEVLENAFSEESDISFNNGVFAESFASC